MSLANLTINLKKDFPNDFIPSFSILKLGLKDPLHSFFQQCKEDTPSFYDRSSPVGGRYDIEK